jgi:hypothetical protein
MSVELAKEVNQNLELPHQLVVDVVALVSRLFDKVPSQFNKFAVIVMALDK